MSLTISATPIRSESPSERSWGPPPGWIIAEHEAGSRTFLAGRAGETPRVPVPVALPSALSAWQEIRSIVNTSKWKVLPSADASGYHFTVSSVGGSPILQADFDRRIELAASTISPSGRYTVFVQANNLATEVTVLDAKRAERWTTLLPHDATLAAYAISIHVDATDSCLAVSEQRATATGAETWYIDLETREVSDPVPGFVVAWQG